MSEAVIDNGQGQRITLDTLQRMMDTFGPRQASKGLSELLAKADEENETCRDFLNELLQSEVRGRNERNRARNYAAAHFPPNPKPLEDFDVSELDSGITAVNFPAEKQR